MNRNLVFILILIILSAGTFLPLLRGGFFEFHDNTQVERVHEMGKMLSQGTFPVRWVPDLGYGYGYPIFNFYSPLPYYIGGIISVLGFSALMSTKLMFLVGIILAPLIMYFSLKKIFNEEASFAGSLVYTYVPYHAVNIYVRGAVAEFFAFAFLPLIILGILRLIGSKNIKSQVWSGFSISAGVFLVAVSHNLTLLMTAVILLPLFILGLFLTGRKVVFAKVFAVSIIAGVLLSSFYTVPAFFEMNQTNVASQIGGGADFRDHFVCIGQFWNSAWGFGGSAPGCLDGLSFKLGKLHIILTVLSLAFLVLRLKNKKWNIYSQAALLSLVVAICTFVLATFFSS